MSFFQPPVGPPDPYEKYRVEEVRESHSERPPFKQDSSGGGKRNLGAYLIQALQKALHLLLGNYEVDEQKAAAKQNISQLKTHFETLKREDRSQDVHFLNDLAENWNEAIGKSVYLLEPSASSLFKEWMKKILQYPENATHTFGYYLTQYAGQKWVPFPYMELIQKIHSEHLKNPEGSSLTEWTNQLGKILQLIKEQ